MPSMVADYGGHSRTFLPTAAARGVSQNIHH